jgi:hypothetical protein
LNSEDKFIKQKIDRNVFVWFSFKIEIDENVWFHFIL